MAAVRSRKAKPDVLALRFARVLRYRDDERAEEADTLDTVRALFAAERALGRGGGKGAPA